MTRVASTARLCLVVAALTAVAVAPTASADRAVARSAIDGIYRLKTTLAELRPVVDFPDELNTANYGTFTAVFDRGRFVVTQQNGGVCTWQYGAFRVAGNRLYLSFLGGGGFGTHAHNRPGERLTFGFALSSTAVTFKAVPGAVSPAPFRVKPWRLVSKTPRWLWAGAKRCLPPRKALPR